MGHRVLAAAGFGKNKFYLHGRRFFWLGSSGEPITTASTLEPDSRLTVVPGTPVGSAAVDRRRADADKLTAAQRESSGTLAGDVGSKRLEHGVIELERAVTHAEFGSLKSGTTYVSVREVFGPPDLLSDNRKGRRIIARYGDIEFRFQDCALHTVAVYLRSGEPVDSGRVPVTDLWPMERRSRQEISDLLTRHDVSWRRDEIMSALTAEADSEVWISDREVHLAFTQGALETIAITSLTG